jgi:AcrR family transcriptional regulator
MDPRREQIADAFKKYFHHYGFKKTSVDDVAAELHISKKTIYSYFDSKESIFAYVIQREAYLLVPSMQQRLQGLLTTQEKISVLIHLVFEQAQLYLETTRGLDFENQEAAARLAFQTAYEEVLKQILQENYNQKDLTQEPVNGLFFSFIKAVIWQGLQAVKSEPVSRVEYETCQAVLKLIS